jgi:hypothetical protein
LGARLRDVGLCFVPRRPGFHRIGRRSRRHRGDPCSRGGNGVGNRGNSARDSDFTHDEARCSSQPRGHWFAIERDDADRSLLFGSHALAERFDIRGRSVFAAPQPLMQNDDDARRSLEHRGSAGIHLRWRGAGVGQLRLPEDRCGQSEPKTREQVSDKQRIVRDRRNRHVVRELRHHSLETKDASIAAAQIARSSEVRRPWWE